MACETGAMRGTLFEFAGGSPAFVALAAAHHARCLADPELNHPFSHPDRHPQHVERLAAYWAEVMGGPAEFSRSCADAVVPTGLAMPHWSWDGLQTTDDLS